MGTENITLDAHSLIWFVDKQSNKQLSKLALQTIKAAEERATVYVPTIALMEVFYLINKGRFPVSFDVIMANIEENEAYQIIPFDVEVMKIAVTLDDFEIHDRIILATSIATGSMLVSKDSAFEKRTDVIW
ncbi:type II toxin-antitoxin system VapC family toxin [Candidatus Poribacteria bacterium]|nr:type II toxin-antitoxin system VapC family toxin [Candidatus Poribacteria bacterium]